MRGNLNWESFTKDDTTAHGNKYSTKPYFGEVLDRFSKKTISPTLFEEKFPQKIVRIFELLKRAPSDSVLNSSI